jgi:N-acetylglucosaminyl-diphospho-decaprenol L-rhamnosyltransferase
MPNLPDLAAPVRPRLPADAALCPLGQHAAQHVTIVCVTYQSAALAQDMADRLRQFPHVVLIDNASGDGCADLLASELPHARMVKNASNLGFARANNQAVALVKTPFALLLNPDCDIALPALEALMAAMAAYPRAAIVAPQGRKPCSAPQPSYRHAFFERRARLPYRIPDGTCSAKWLHGCCMLVRVAAFRHFGGFDERFFLYYEDDDLCLRALAAGYDCLLEPAAEVLHAGGASCGSSPGILLRKQFHFFRSRHAIIGKYLGPRAALFYLAKSAVAAPFAVTLYLLLMRRRHALKWLAWGCAAWRRIGAALVAVA